VVVSGVDVSVAAVCGWFSGYLIR
ncbi:hypothetical protein A2U01_0063095, partial [Trifolium medium]|nr:hypothetical protein [Trifolium medium]